MCDGNKRITHLEVPGDADRLGNLCGPRSVFCRQEVGGRFVKTGKMVLLPFFLKQTERSIFPKSRFRQGMPMRPLFSDVPVFNGFGKDEGGYAVVRIT